MVSREFVFLSLCIFSVSAIHHPGTEDATVTRTDVDMIRLLRKESKSAATQFPQSIGGHLQEVDGCDFVYNCSDTLGEEALQYFATLLKSSTGFVASRQDDDFKARVAPQIEGMNEILTTATSTVQSTVQVVDASAGVYDACHISSSIFWLYMWGHTRTIGMHTNNLNSFIEQTQPCSFITVYTRKEIDHEPEAQSAGWVPNNSAQLKDFEKRGVTAATVLNDVSSKRRSNFAWVTVDRSYIHEQRDLLMGAVIFGHAVAEEHSIPTSDSDIVAVSRPDIVFSHAVNFPRLSEVMEHVPFATFAHHEFKKIGFQDPSEMFVVSSRKMWAQTCLDMHGGCGNFIQAPAKFGVAPFFYNTDIKLRIHRLNGDFGLGEMRPVGGDGMQSPNDGVKGVVDLTKGANHVDGITFDWCKKATPAPTTPWGVTHLSRRVNSGCEGYWITNPVDITDRVIA